MKQTNKNLVSSMAADSVIGHVNDENALPSKTKLKAEADALQALGVRLCELPKDKLQKLNLPEALYTAVLESKKITANGATRRHKQYLGKLMREIDTADIEEQLSRWDGKHSAENAYFHGLERWRDRLINEPNALAEFMGNHPNTESQRIRTLIRNAQKELASNKPPKSSRELFKLLREVTSDTNAAKNDDMNTSNEILTNADFD
jgi:ribosome-associated protein